VVRKSKAVAPSKRGRKKAGKSVKKAKTTREPGETQTGNTYDWLTSYAAVLVYLSQHDHCNVPNSIGKAIYECDIPNFGEGGSNLHYVGKLGLWLRDQRKFKRAGKLSSEHEALLQQLADEGMY